MFIPSAADPTLGVRIVQATSFDDDAIVCDGLDDTVSASVLGLGLNPTAGQVEAAICDDFKRGHATKLQEQSGYKLASTYYGWNFDIDPAKVTCP